MIKKKVLMTGDSGFLGRHLTSKLDKLGWDISVSNSRTANLLDEKNLHIYNNIKFDYIFHLAAHTKAGDYCLHNKGEQFEINQQINTNILKYWKHHQPQAKMIAMGTSCSYSPELLMVEDNYLLSEPDKDLYTYAMTKRMLLVGLKAYAEQYGLKYLYYIPSTLYGVDFDVNDTHFIFDLIKKIYAGKYGDNTVELWGDGYQRRELSYVNDVIDSIINTLDYENEVLNVSSGVDYSIRDFAEIVSNIIGYDSTKIEYNINKYVGVKEKNLQVKKLIKLYPNNKFTPPIVGIKETIDYYINKVTE